MAAEDAQRATTSRRVLATLTLTSAVSQGAGRFAYPVLLPAMDHTVLHSYVVAGLLGTLNFAAYFIGTVFVTLGADRHDPSLLVRRGIVLITCGLAVLAIGPGPVVLGLGMLLTGFGSALTWIPTPGLLGRSVPPERRGMAIGLSGTGIGLAVVVCSVVAPLLHRALGEGSWRWAWAGLALIGLVACVCAHRVVRLPVEVGSGPQRLAALRSVPGWLGASLSYACYGLCITIYMNYAVAGLEQDAHYSNAHAALEFSTIGIAMAVGGLLLGRLSDHLGRRLTLVLSHAGMGVGALLITLHAEPWTALSAVLLGLGVAGAPTVLAAHLSDTLPPRSFAAAFGAMTGFIGLAQLGGPQLGGWLADVTGSFTPTYLTSAGAAALAAAAAATMPRATRSASSRALERARA